MTPEDKIDELEAALTANDEYLQKVQAHNAELLAACKAALRLDYFQEHNALAAQVKAAVAKAEGRE